MSVTIEDNSQTTTTENAGSTETTPVIVRGSTQEIIIRLPDGTLTEADKVEVWFKNGKNGKSIVKTITQDTYRPHNPPSGIGPGTEPEIEYPEIDIDPNLSAIMLMLSENETLMFTQSPCYIQVRLAYPKSEIGPYSMPPAVAVTKILKLAVEPSLWDEPILPVTKKK